MSGINKIMLIGNLGNSPELKQTSTGVDICTFSIATSKKNKNKEEVTQWHNIVAFNKTAEIIATYAQKGSKMYVEGEMNYSKYEKEGVMVTSAKIIVNQFEFLGSRTAVKDDNADDKPSYKDDFF